jgi:(E)-4-hydroxy-3-methylbut-2-enyl-diphosphate synthase
MTSEAPFLLLNLSKYSRRVSREVNIGDIALGGKNPIRVQTMTTTNTNNIDLSVEQSIRAINAGAEYVRLTTQGVREAQSLGEIKQELRIKGYTTPLIADIHFNPAAALEATKYADKIRINPGNYSDKSRTSTFTHTDSEYEKDLETAEIRFLELLTACKMNGVAIRIGVNHGSLSQRIMSRYGDTPLGMAHSAMEFVRICNKHNHMQVVVSMKSSNTRVMVQATRYLVMMMKNEGIEYPLHLGVTEAGEGEDGRIKSAVGIGALLIDGIGDTIRVSLTEEPENEIPVAKCLTSLFENWKNNQIEKPKSVPLNPFEFVRRKSNKILNIGGENVPVVIANLSNKSNLTTDAFESWGWYFHKDLNKWTSGDNAADYFVVDDNVHIQVPQSNTLPLIGYGSEFENKLINSDTFINSYIARTPPQSLFVKVNPYNISTELIDKLKTNPNAIVVLDAESPYDFYATRNAFFKFIDQNLLNPCIVSLSVKDTDKEDFQIISSAILGPLLIDGLGDGIMILGKDDIPAEIVKSTSFGILQAARVRISKTEFISCPGCGRTLFSLNKTLKSVKDRTSHLKGLKIGIMGCIVNGPGEMADADYGYVGSGNGKVTLYRKREVVKKNIDEANAVDELIELIKANGDWIDAPLK